MMPMGASLHLTVNLAFLVVLNLQLSPSMSGVEALASWYKKGKLRPQLSATAAAQDLTCEFPRQL